MGSSRVETEQGVLRGDYSGGLHVFKGVPFARPPVGALRLRPPEPPEPWTKERDATAFGPAAPQPGGSLEATLFADIAATSEDCLYLNIWTPRLEGNMPVMLWLHGGAFVFGAGSQVVYDGSALASRGEVVIVTINYRLGALGFLYAEGGDGEGPTSNLGLLDQVAALEWVQRNISAFGGNPGNVTLFGESAGAMSVCTLLGVPRARGLFRKAIAQSGACQACATAEEGQRVAELFLKELGGSPDPLRRLREAPVAEIIAAQGRVMGRYERQALIGTNLLSFSPVIDGHVLPEHPLHAIESGAASGIPLLIGTNRDETKLFSLGDPGASALDRDGVVGRVAAVLGDRQAAEAIVQTYERARGKDVTPSDLWTALGTDYVFRLPAVRVASGHSAHADVWSYIFSWRSSPLGGFLGASHAVEVPFVWGTISLPPIAKLLGDGPATARLAEAMQDAWTAFARSGAPASPSLPPWPRYDRIRRPTMILDTASHVEDDPHKDERVAWSELSGTPQ